MNVRIPVWFGMRTKVTPGIQMSNDPGNVTGNDPETCGEAPTVIARVILGLCILLLGAVVVGCGGSDAPNPTAAPTSLPITPTSPPVVVEPTAMPPTLPPTTGNNTDSTEIIDQGKILFETTAGGVGCALCHGLDGRGKPELATPQNRGATADMIWDALETRAQMTFLVLTNDEVRAIAAYLQVLDTQP